MSLRGQYEFQRGTIAHLPIETLDVANGSRVNIDAGGVPIVNAMFLNGTAVDPTTAAYAIQVTQEQDQTPAAITGLYDLEFDTAAFSRGDVITFDIEGVIDGVTVNTLKDTVIVDDPTSRPVIC